MHLRAFFAFTVLAIAVGFSGTSRADQAPPGPAAAPPAAPPAVDGTKKTDRKADLGLCNAGDFSLLKSDADASVKTPRLMFGDRLDVAVSPTCAAEIMKSLETSRAASGELSVTLMFGDVRLTDIKGSVLDVAKEPLMIGFVLGRNNTGTSRDQWSRVFRGNSPNPNDWLEIPIGLDLGSGPIRHVGKIEFASVPVWSIRAVTWISLLIFFGFMTWAIKHSELLRDNFVSTSQGFVGKVSLAKTQMAFWFGLVGLTVAAHYFLFLNLEFIPDSMLWLMGISASTVVASRVSIKDAEPKDRISASGDKNPVTKAVGDLGAVIPEKGMEGIAEKFKAVQEAVANTLPAPITAPAMNAKFWFDQIIRDAEGRVSLHRLQAFLWTLLLGGVYVAEVTLVIALPDFDTNMLLLMGVSNGGYVAMKSMETAKAT